jgi:hypothetical protein
MLSVNLNNLVRLYQSGLSTYQVARQLGIHHTTVFKYVRRAGVARTRSEAWHLRPGTLEHLSLMGKLGGAKSLGRRWTDEAKARQALTSQANRSHVGPNEAQVIEALTSRGIQGTPQLAIGPYNSDFATGTVSVEVLSGYWHLYGTRGVREQHRLRDLLHRGWSVLYVIVEKKRSPFTAEVADYVVSLLEKANRHPPRPAQYWVVRSGPEMAATGSEESDRLAFVPPFRLGRDRTTGRYLRLPKDTLGM